jgi:MFS family permease
MYLTGIVAVKLDLIFEDVTIHKRRLLAISILLASTFSWFFAFDFIIQTRILGSSDWLSLNLIESAIFLAITIIAMLFGSLISEKVNRRNLLAATIILGIALAPLLLIAEGTWLKFLILSFLGFSLGLGIPSCLAYLAESTTVNERGRVSGISIAISFVLIFAGVAAILLLGFSALAILILCIIRLSGFIGLLIDRCEKVERKPASWRSILMFRNFLLYILPWLMISVADGLKALIYGNFTSLPNFAEVDNFGYYFRYVCVGVFGLFAGVIADRFGRRQPIIIGTVLMGVSYTFLSFISSTSLIPSDFWSGMEFSVYILYSRFRRYCLYRSQRKILRSWGCYSFNGNGLLILIISSFRNTRISIPNAVPIP